MTIQQSYRDQVMKGVTRRNFIKGVIAGGEPCFVGDLSLSRVVAFGSIPGPWRSPDHS